MIWFVTIFIWRKGNYGFCSKTKLFKTNIFLSPQNLHFTNVSQCNLLFNSISRVILWFILRISLKILSLEINFICLFSHSRNKINMNMVVWELTPKTHKMNVWWKCLEKIRSYVLCGRGVSMMVGFEDAIWNSLT